MNPVLLSLAAQAGAKVVENILARKIGADNAGLVGEVINTIASAAGVAPDQLETFAQDNPEVVTHAITQAEEMSPQLIALYTSSIEHQYQLLLAEDQGPAWKSAWRPLGMYLIGFLWLWNAVLLHSLNAVFKIALPPIPWAVLLQVTSLYLALYMGGHTVKDFVSKKWGGK